MANPAATGKGKVGFNSKYKKNGVLESETEFELDSVAFHVHLHQVQWLVLSGAGQRY